MDVAAPLRAIDRYQRPRTWLALPIAVVKRFGESRGGAFAATIAYYGFFSLFPLLMALASIAGIVLHGRTDLQERIVRSALAQFPVVGTQIRRDVGDIEGSALAIVVGLALALWAGLGGVRAAQVAMDTLWDVPHKRRPGTPASIARALVMLVVLGAFVAGGAALAAVSAGAAGVAGVVSFAASAVLNAAVVALAYRVLTSADVAWRDVVPGAVLTGIAWTVLLAIGGAIIERRIASSSDVYGTFAIVIGLLAWIYLGAQLLLLGAELNVVRAHRLWPRSLQGDDRTEADERALTRSAKQEERRHDEHVTVGFDGEREPRDPTAVGPGSRSS